MEIMKQKKNLQDYQDDSNEMNGGRTPEDLVFGPGNQEAIRLASEAVGQLVETWGFKRILGATWAFLYLCPEPASAKDICRALGVSPALVSITLQDLQRWEIVKKLSSLGKRRDYYVAEHDIQKLIRKAIQERERVQAESLSEKLKSALVSLETERSQRPDLTGKRTCQFQKVRVEELLQASQALSRGLEALAQGGQATPSLLRAVPSLKQVS